MAYEYSLKYYDTEILSRVDSEIVQMWSFRPFETAGKKANIKLTTGTFIDESMFQFSKNEGVKNDWGIGTINHMTVDQNRQWAEKVYRQIR
jgi:hypothetical protein